MRAWGGKNVKCAPCCGLLKAMGRKTPIGAFTIVSQWGIIHRNEMWRNQKVWGQVQEDIQWKGCILKTVTDKLGQWYN
jgi:hypothetical protein